jgi:6-phosphogluconolactonase
MRCVLTSVLLVTAVRSLSADTYVYASMAPEMKIQVFRLDPADGKLTPVEAFNVSWKPLSLGETAPSIGSPGSLVVDPQRKFLFASLRVRDVKLPKVAPDGPMLAGYRVNPANGKLSIVNKVLLPREVNVSFVNTDRTGRWLLSAAYDAGKIMVHKLGEDGKIQADPVETVRTAMTAHCIVTDRDNRWVFVPHVAPNAIYQFRFDPENGKLTSEGKAPGGAEKAGPRHLAFHPRQNIAFTSDESGSSITAYRVDPREGLKLVQTLSTLPVDFKGQNSTADVKVHPSGKFVWVSNRGHDSLAGFAIDNAGKLKSLGQTQTEKTPRSFDLDPDGRYVFSAGEGSGKLAVYKIDLGTGKLTLLHTYDVGKSLSWVQVVKVAK